MPSRKLTPEDWIACGLRTLAAQGPEAVQIKVLAAALSATKGSFYWHFKDLAALKSAMLSLWLERGAGDVITAVAALPDPAERLRRLAQFAADPAPEAFGGRALEPAIRAWASSDPQVEQAVARIDSLRLAFLTDLMGQLGRPDPDLARLFYGAFLGLDDLAARGTGPAERPLTRLVEMILRDRTDHPA